MTTALKNLKTKKVVADPTKSSLQQKKPVTKSGHTTGQMAKALYGGLSSKPPVSSKKVAQQSKTTTTAKAKATQADRTK